MEKICILRERAENKRDTKRCLNDFLIDIEELERRQKSQIFLQFFFLSALADGKCYRKEIDKILCFIKFLKQGEGRSMVRIIRAFLDEG